MSADSMASERSSFHCSTVYCSTLSRSVPPPPPKWDFPRSSVTFDPTHNLDDIQLRAISVPGFDNHCFCRNPPVTLGVKSISAMQMPAVLDDGQR